MELTDGRDTQRPLIVEWWNDRVELEPNRSWQVFSPLFDVTARVTYAEGPAGADHWQAEAYRDQEEEPIRCQGAEPISVLEELYLQL